MMTTWLVMSLEMAPRTAPKFLPLLLPDTQTRPLILSKPNNLFRQGSLMKR